MHVFAIAIHKPMRMPGTFTRLLVRKGCHLLVSQRSAATWAYLDHPRPCVIATQTASPTTPPTSSPTAPTYAPTRHACTDGSHGCDQTEFGTCTPDRRAVPPYACGCAATHHCVPSCTATGHTCEWATFLPTSSPISDSFSPTAQPTKGPTAASSGITTTTLPMSPTPPPTASTPCLASAPDAEL